MTKQEKIQEAYGDYWNERKEHVDENGWDTQLKFYEIDRDKFDTQTKGHGIYISRPKSLKGIEDNNGWIKVESEDNLPEQGGEYIVLRMAKKSTATYCKNNRWIVHENTYPKTTFQQGITHYRKKELIPNPIY